MLRESNWSTPEHKEIEGISSGRMEHVHGYSGHTIYHTEVKILGVTNELIRPSRVPCPPANTERFSTGLSGAWVHNHKFNFITGTDENRQFVASIVFACMFMLQLQ